LVPLVQRGARFDVGGGCHLGRRETFLTNPAR
jgi:hypothetical protein